jgi:hypothetical protein
MMMTDSPKFDVETALAATIAPRVTEDRIKAVIVGQTFARLTGTLTVCVLTLANGFTVTGESACASPDNYDQDIGEYYARKDAERRIWPLEGYLLRQQLHDATMPEIENLDATEQPGLEAGNANTRWRKKPVVITAITFDQLVAHGIELGAALVNGMPWSFDYNGHPITHETDDCYLIPTLEGTMNFTRGDMLITGVKGEIYPCKLDIFAATYDPAEEQANQYADLPPHMQRVAVERDELHERLAKLKTFIDGPTFASLSEERQLDLVDQQAHMCAYLARLNIRLSR